MAPPNPLASAKKVMVPTEPHPMLAHAQMWQHVGKMDSDTLAKQTATSSYGLPILAKLAGDPNVTARDVIKAAAAAAGDGKIDPSQAVKLISAMPGEPDKLQPWLKGLFQTHMTALVHMKAAAMQQPQGQPPAAAPAQPAPGAQPPPGGVPQQ